MPDGSLGGVLERTVEARVVRDARKRWGLKGLKVTFAGEAGYTDRLFLTAGSPTWVEFKPPGGAPRPLQVHRMNELRALGYRVAWFDDYGRAMDYLRAIVEGRNG